MSVIRYTVRFSLLGLLLASFAPLPAFAKGTTSLDAKTGWHLSSSKSPQPYCTLTQTYMDNVVVNFARNAKGERALAVDFQADRLQTGQEIPVQVSAGDVKKSFKITPKSARVLRLQLGADTAFEQALAKAKTLELRMGDEAFKIYTAEFAKELPQIDTCLTALQAPPPPPEPVKSAVPAEPTVIAKADPAPVAKVQPDVKPPAQEIVKAPDIVENPLPPLLKQPPVQKTMAQSPPLQKQITRLDAGVIDLTRVQPKQVPVDVVVPIAKKDDAAGGQAALSDVERRYEESQKEIRRLGLAMKQAEEDHAREKRQLEEMIVDPSVQAKVEDVRLKQLEEQLANSQGQIARLEQRLSMEDRAQQPSLGRNPIADFFSSGDGTGVWGGEPPAAPVKKRRVEPPPAPVPSALAVDEDVFVEPAKPAPPPVAVKPALHYWQANDIASLLRTSDIVVKGDVKTVQSRQADTKIFRWQAENHKGMAEQSPLPDKAMFQSRVDATLARYKSGCVGQFAADRADAPEFAKGAQVQAHDVACVAQGGKGSASSLLFHAKDGVMTVLVLEGTPSAMTDAMDERDALVNSLMQ